MSLAHDVRMFTAKSVNWVTKETGRGGPASPQLLHYMLRNQVQSSTNKYGETRVCRFRLPLPRAFVARLGEPLV
jgi:hypothetical protein